MKKVFLAFALCMSVLTPSWAAGGGAAWDKAPDRGTDLAALQHGAKLFVNYCLNCHSASFMRFNRLRDIGLTDKEIQSNLNFLTDKVGGMMVSAIDPDQAKAMFGKAPPDLTLIARSRAGHGGTGGDYVYSLLRSYYADPSKPTGWNNTIYPNIGMPNPLWQLQGQREPIFEEVEAHGEKTHVLRGWKQVKPGMMSERAFDDAVGDLAAYLTWMAEPVRNTRVAIGVWVLMFLGVFAIVAWRLNAAFWKDVK